MFRLLTIPLVVAGLALSSACAQPRAVQQEVAAPAQPAVAADGTQQATVRVGNSMNFDPKNITLKAGQPVQVTLQNAGNIPHDFTLTSGVASPVKIQANGGQTARATFTIDQPGTYTFICSVPGHESNGMRGTLTVQ